MKGWTRDLLLALLLITIGVLGRAVPHAPNATPVAAAALFAAFAIRHRALAAVVPLATLALSDGFVRGGYDGRVMIAVYVSMASLVLLRPWLASGRPLRIVGCSLGGSVLFFLTTNLAVWATGWGYEPTLAGLARCYANGLPFLRNMVLGDLYWCGVLFGGAGLVEFARGRIAVRGCDPAVTAG